jgi:uncharacterized damage-inducible protein DinB
MTAPRVQDERQGLLSFIEHQRQAVRNAAHGLSEEQARQRPTPSELSIGGLIKHLAYAEDNWRSRVEGHPESERAFQDFMGSFTLQAGETLVEMLQRYAEAAARTQEVIASIDDLGRKVVLQPAPWNPSGCTVRWVLMHLIEETARHAGHADIIREAIDGATATPLMAAVEQWPESQWVKPWRPAG